MYNSIPPSSYYEPYGDHKFGTSRCGSLFVIMYDNILRRQGWFRISLGLAVG